MCFEEHARDIFKLEMDDGTKLLFVMIESSLGKKERARTEDSQYPLQDFTGRCD